MQLRPGLTVVRAGTDEVQIGTDPRWSVRVGGLTEAEVYALLALDLHGEGDEPDRRRAASGRWPGGAERGAALVAALDVAGLTRAGMPGPVALASTSPDPVPGPAP